MSIFRINCVNLAMMIITSYLMVFTQPCLETLWSSELQGLLAQINLQSPLSSSSGMQEICHMSLIIDNQCWITVLTNNITAYIHV